MKIDKFPQEIVDLVLEYAGYHVWRKGRFMAQIQKNDPRRTLLQKRPLAKRLKNYHIPFWEVIIKRPVYFKEYDRIYISVISVHQRYNANGELKFYWIKESNDPYFEHWESLKNLQNMN